MYDYSIVFNAQGKPVMGGFVKNDPTMTTPGNTLKTQSSPPAITADYAWLLDGEVVNINDYLQAEMTIIGLTVGLSVGHVFDEGHGEVTEPDTVTVPIDPDNDRGVAIEVVQRADDSVDLEYCTWNPLTESKGDPAFGDTVLQTVLEGVLPAGATSFDELEVE